MMLNDRELGTVLAALRSWQSRGYQGPHLLGIATRNGQVEPLTFYEIDALCRRLNTGG